MMKSLKSILLTISLLCSLSVIACGPGPLYTPSNYQLFRVATSGGDYSPEFIPHANENILAWQSLCDQTVLYADIHEAVYKFTCDDINTVLKTNTNSTQNTFIQWILDHQKSDYLQLLLLAKRCEQTRNELNDPWYFPRKEDPVKGALVDIEHQAQEQVVQQTDMSDRYALQQMRAMFSLNKWDECLNLWKSYAYALPENNVMRMLMMDYVYGAACHVGGTEKAQLIVKEQGSQWFASFLLDPNVYRGVSSMEKAYDTYPNCPQLLSKLQLLLGEEGLDWRMRDTATMKAVLTFTERVIRERKVSDLAPWYYSASFIEDWFGNSAQSIQYIRKAQQCKTTPFMSESIRLWAMYLDYQKALPSDKVLLNDLQWLAHQQEQETAERKPTEGDWYDRWAVNACWQMDFWHDAMRRIVHTALVPKYVEKGNMTRALELTNYGANWYFRNDSLCSDYWHSDIFFSMLYPLSAQQAEQYVSHTLHPTTELDRWLAKGGNTMPDYLWDAVGTMYLREANYTKAITAFEHVSPSFQVILNDELWRASLFHDPFSPQYPRLIRRSDCKLNFAREMRDLKQQMQHSPNVNRRAYAQIRYAIGLRNSFTCCRALTRYNRLESKALEDQRLRYLNQSEQLIQSALAMFDNDEDAAQANLYLLNFATVVERYPNTTTAEYIRYSCDKYYDYHCEQFLPLL